MAPPSSTFDPFLSAIETSRFARLPDLLLPHTPPNAAAPNPFAFLSRYPLPRHTHLLRSILQSLLPLRPRSLSHPALRLLLSHTLISNAAATPLPLSLAVLHSSLRAACPLPHQARLSLSLSWLRRRGGGGGGASVADVLAEAARETGFPVGRGVCNYLISSLCAVGETAEAAAVLRGMSAPDSEGYGALVAAACRGGRVAEATRLVREMVGRCGVTPRQGTVALVVAAMGRGGEARAAREVVEWLERMGVELGFECYEKVLEGCLGSGEYGVAGEVVVTMAAKGFIPRIGARLRVVEGLAAAGEAEFAGKVRRALAAMNS